MVLSDLFLQGGHLRSVPRVWGALRTMFFVVNVYSNEKVMWSQLIRSNGSLEGECGVCWATLTRCIMRVRGKAFHGSTGGVG